ncbi:MAG: hypothetical protein C0616_14485 [Desulfuromonas sp.]|nr:MAG: hypothetical protein C0616_14485 [Desulfuromonas sp.]
MKTRLSIVLTALLLTACGPIIGAGMVAGNGVKDFKVVSGDLQDLQIGSRLVLLSPFAKTSQSFYICRGEDASEFADAFNAAGLFVAEVAFGEPEGRNLREVEKLQALSPADLQSQLALSAAPQVLLTGTILKRETVAAPVQGVLMKVAYRLEFLRLDDGMKTVVEVAVQDHFQDCIATAVKELLRRKGI